jgi:MFS transporter, DHA1 family, inner membrane transport protein
VLKKNAGIVLGVCAGITLGQIGPILQPYQVGAFVDGAHKTPSVAGIILACQMISYSVCLVGVSRFMNRFSLFIVGVTGASLSAVAFLASAWLTGDASLTLANIFIGIGQGLLFAAASASAAGVAESERVYGMGATVALVIYGILLAVIPFIQRHFGIMSIFWVSAGTMVLFGPALLGLRTSKNVSEDRSATFDMARAVALIVMLTLFGLGSGAIYAFAERIGNHIGIEPQTLGLAFMIATTAGALGSGAAAWIGLRLGRSLPLYLALLSTGLSSLALALSTTLAEYSLSLLAFQIAYTFSFPYFLGAGASLDPSGRLSTLCSGMIFLPSALGTIFAGFLAQYFSYTLIGVFAFAMCASAVVFVPSIVGRRVPAVG